MSENCINTEYCCGVHEVCEKGLLRKESKVEVEYYDDEELDLFQGRESESYTQDEIDQFREILETMFKSDVAGWLKSLESRNILLPDQLRNHSQFSTLNF